MSNTKKVLVTGAAGLVGNAVCRQLVARGDDVIAIDRFGSKRVNGIAITQCDLNNIHRLHELANQGVDGIIHCGAYSGPMVARDDPHSMVQVNIVGTANILEIARQYQIQRVVFCSSTSVYGHTPPGPVIEDVTLAPASLYAASKVASEQLVTVYASQYGVDGVSLRLSWVYGPGRTTACVIRTMIQNTLKAEPTRLDYGQDFYRQYIHMDDAANALILALDSRNLSRRVYNITGGSYKTLSDVAALVQKIMPSADIELAPGPDPLDEVQEEFDILSATQDLEYRPSYSLEAGLRQYADWLTQQYERQA